MADKKPTYREGDVVHVRGTVKKVRGELRVQLKKDEARLKVGDLDIARTESQVLAPGDLIEYTDIDRPSDPVKHGTIRRVDAGQIWARFDDGSEAIVAQKHTVRLDD